MSCRSLVFLSLHSATTFFKSHQRCSMVFKSGDCDNHSSTFSETWPCRMLRIIVLLKGPVIPKLQLPHRCFLLGFPDTWLNPSSDIKHTGNLLHVKENITEAPACFSVSSASVSADFMSKNPTWHLQLSFQDLTVHTHLPHTFLNRKSVVSLMLARCFYCSLLRLSCDLQAPKSIVKSRHCKW